MTHGRDLVEISRIYTMAVDQRMTKSARKSLVPEDQKTAPVYLLFTESQDDLSLAIGP